LKKKNVKLLKEIITEIFSPQTRKQIFGKVQPLNYLSGRRWRRCGRSGRCGSRQIDPALYFDSIEVGAFRQIVAIFLLLTQEIQIN
jgi:hypothetical protein